MAVPSRARSTSVLATVPIARRDSSSACFKSGVLLTRRLVFACRLNGPWTLTGPLTHTHTYRYPGKRGRTLQHQTHKAKNRPLRPDMRPPAPAHVGGKSGPSTCTGLLEMGRDAGTRPRGPTGGDSNHGNLHLRSGACEVHTTRVPLQRDRKCPSPREMRGMVSSSVIP
jgi:hypothetical protein